MRRLALLMLLAVSLVPWPGRASPSWKPRAASYAGVATQRDVRVAMSDGMRLATDVLRPADSGGNPASGRFPAILTQTPYNKNALSFASNYLVQRGFVQVVAEVRGTGSSEGDWASFDAREQQDGAELVRWIISQPWSNGKVALHGTSYGAINQFFTAHRASRSADKAVANAVRAMFPIVPMSDAYRDISGSGGQINTSFIPLWLGLVTGLAMTPATYVAEDPQAALAQWAAHVLNVPNFQVNMVAEAAQGGEGAYDGPFYRERSPIEIVDQVRVPTFVVGGWFDLFQRGEPLLYRRLRANGVPARLLMGPWYHISPSLDSGLPAANAPYTLDELELRWFDRYVNGLPDPTLDRDVAQVTYWPNGGTKYRTASQWPPKGVTFRQQYLHQASPVTGGTLSPQRPGAEPPDTLVWQPASGLCSRSTVQWTAGGGTGTPCETDNEINDATGLFYDVALPTGLQLAGPIAARLFVSTDAKDAFLTARVEDVDANGRATQLTAGWQTLSLSRLNRARSEMAGGLVVRPYHDFTKASQFAVEAGRIYEVWVEIFPTAATLAPGHRLRLSIQPSDAPHLTPSVPQTVSLAGGVLQLWHDPAHPSALVLPVQPG